MALLASYGVHRHRRADYQPHHDRTAVVFTATLRRPELVALLAVRPGAAAAAGRVEPGGGGASPECGTGPQEQGGAEYCLWGGITRFRDHLAQGRGHRQRPHEVTSPIEDLAKGVKRWDEEMRQIELFAERLIPAFR
jgi:hypothetical protein